MSAETIVVIVVSLLLIIGSLIYARRRSNTLSGFLVSERSLGGVASAFTYSTAAVSAGLFLGGAGFAYTYGWAGATYQLGALTGIFITWLLIAPRVRKIAAETGAMSTPKFLAERFKCPSFRTVTALLTVIFVLPMLVVQFRGAGLLFEGYLGLNYTWSIVLFGILAGLFTALGGNSAVSYLGVIQGVAMVIGSLVCIGVGLLDIGGLHALNAQLAAADTTLVQFVGRVPWPVWWNLIFIFGLAQFSNPHLIPRFFSLRDDRAVRLALPLSLAINCVWVCAAVLIGLVTRVQNPGLPTGDHAMPVFMTSLPGALSFVILMALLSAIFSTVDTLLLAVGSNVSHDVLKAIIFPNMSERRELLVARLSMGALCVVCFGLSLMDLPLITLINSFAMGAFILILGVPLVMALFMKRPTLHAALTASIGGPIFYVFWKYTFAQPTGIGEMIASLVVIIPIVLVVNGLMRQPSLEMARKTGNGIEDPT